MVSLNIANAFAPLDAVENDISSAKQNKDAAMAEIISDTMKIRSKTTLFDGVIQIGDILNEQKVINWKVLLLGQFVDHGRDTLLALLKARTKIAPEITNLALSTWDGEMVESFLQYNSVKIDNEVIRFAAGNLNHGKEIMEMLLAQEMEREISETMRETALETTLESAQQSALPSDNV
ncbi:hypothetical protein BOTNAR_0588g00030 [Botryotinia narcissicola]|uniref:Uncharacterized protein n=1 Tax=Botryotinia narcissicola TaxID=278944 RepID=A0A4Z1HNB1_9HELO|nr:hypothetical protein BOTNAR_0588g00030 [Botryotinia narcissicola]